MPNNYAEKSDAELEALVATKLGWKWWKVVQGEPYQLRVVSPIKTETVWTQDIVPAYCREEFIKRKSKAYHWKYEPSEPVLHRTSQTIEEVPPPYCSSLDAAMGLVKEMTKTGKISFLAWCNSERCHADFLVVETGHRLGAVYGVKLSRVISELLCLAHDAKGGE